MGQVGKEAFALASETGAHPLFSHKSAMDTSREHHTSSEFSNFETESVHHTDKEIQADLDHTSHLEGSEYSSQEGNVLFKDVHSGIEFAVQIREKMDAVGDVPASSYMPDDMTETLDNKNQTGRLAVSTQSGTSSQIMAADIELEKMRLDGALTRMRYRYDDNECRRQHEEIMEKPRQQTISQSISEIGQQLHELLQPQNCYALFFFCFVFTHLIYTLKELAFYIITKHHLFCFGILLYFIFKKIVLVLTVRYQQVRDS